MSLIAAIHWKTNNAPGVRCFSNGDDGNYARRRIERSKEDFNKLHLVKDVWVFWPESLGPFPDEATLDSWEAEYAAQPPPKTLEERIIDLEKKSP